MRIFDLAELEATIARNPGRKTTTLWDTLAVEAPAEHQLQRRFLRLCRRHGLAGGWSPGRKRSSRER
jgi:hypothetical protein